jgi:hypothetical protein
MQNVKLDLAEAMTQGHIFVINIDDSNADYKEVFDPDICEFQSPDCFPSLLFRVSSMKKPENYQ